MSVTLHTSAGDLKLELFCEQVPGASRNFLALCGKGYYDNTVFHRNIANFMIQGGDPTGTGKGGNAADRDFIPDEFVGAIRHDRRGIVAMANRGINTNGKDFVSNRM
jgi:peptidyl-prolyl cis-trans isomerase-like 3